MSPVYCRYCGGAIWPSDLELACDDEKGLTSAELDQELEDLLQDVSPPPVV